MSAVTEVPPLSPNPDLAELAAAVRGLIEYQRAREPTAAGDPSAKFITLSKAVEVGLLELGVGGGPGGGVYVPPDDTLDDLSPPAAAQNLQAFSSVAYIMVTIDPPTYNNGRGNGYTEIFAANYSGSGPLPVFGDAVPIGTMSGRSPVLVIDAEPGVEVHFWAGSVTANGVRQVDTSGPTGGINGVVATPGLIDSQHIVALTASKITAGNIGVGEDITSTGFVSGSAGWRIRGNGFAEFADVVARGSVYASGGAIGGALIGTNYVQSTNYNGTTLGWRLDNDLGKVFAKAGEIAAFTIDGKVLKLGTAALDASGTGIAMGTDTDALNKLYVGNSTHGIHFDGTDFNVIGDVVGTDNVVADGITKTWGVTYTTSTGTGAGHQTGVNGTFTAGSKITLFSGGEVRGPGSGTATLQLQRYEGHDDTTKTNLTVLFGPIDVDYGGVFLFPPFVDTLTTAGAYTYEIWKTAGPGLRNRSIVLQEFKR